MENIKLVCKDCKKEFDYTVGEQKFYENKGFPAPIRCKECRDAKKARNEAKSKEDKLEDLLKNLRENTVQLQSQDKNNLDSF